MFFINTANAQVFEEDFENVDTDESTIHISPIPGLYENDVHTWSYTQTVSGMVSFDKLDSDDNPIAFSGDVAALLHSSADVLSTNELILEYEKHRFLRFDSAMTL